MTKSTITRERLEQLADNNTICKVSWDERIELAQIALAAMDSEPHTDDELSNLLWYSQEATCHSDPNYYCEFQRLATPGLIAGIIRELQERRKADSEPVAYTDERNLGYIDRGRETAYLWGKQNSEASDVALYLHAQPELVVHGEVASAIEELKRTLVDCNRYNYCFDAVTRVENACRAAMLNGGKS